MTTESEFSVDQLLKDAEPRDRLSKKEEQEMFNQLHSDWRVAVDSRRRKTWFVAAAATLVLGLFAARIDLPEDVAVPATVAVARVESQFGLNRESTLAKALANNTSLVSNTVVETYENERLALDLVGGGKLRLNEMTVVRLLGTQAVELVSGSVYYDSDDKAPALLDSLYEKNSIAIRTSFGELRNKGTQFLVDAISDRLVVTVRSGSVDVNAGSRLHAIEAGHQMIIEHSVDPHTRAVPGYGDAWSWVEQTLPDMDLNDPPIILFLEWVGHETGREIVFTSDAALRLAQTKTLVGKKKVDLLPLDALYLWMDTVDLEATVSEDRITIALRE